MESFLSWCVFTWRQKNSPFVLLFCMFNFSSSRLHFDSMTIEVQLALHETREQPTPWANPLLRALHCLGVSFLQFCHFSCKCFSLHSMFCSDADQGAISTDEVVALSSIVALSASMAASIPSSHAHFQLYTTFVCCLQYKYKSALLCHENNCVEYISHI